MNIILIVNVKYILMNERSDYEWRSYSNELEMHEYIMAPNETSTKIE